jgi:hypothetical protein
MAWTEAQKKYARSEKGKISRKKYQSSEKAKEAHRRYMLKRKAKLAEAKKTKAATVVEPVKNKVETVKMKKSAASKKSS